MAPKRKAGQQGGSVSKAAKVEPGAVRSDASKTLMNVEYYVRLQEAVNVIEAEWPALSAEDALPLTGHSPLPICTTVRLPNATAIAN